MLANARSQGHHHLLAQPPGILCCVKALGLGTHFGAKAPGFPGGMVTSQIDTCMTANEWFYYLQQARNMIKSFIHPITDYRPV